MKSCRTTNEKYCGLIVSEPCATNLALNQAGTTARQDRVKQNPSRESHVKVNRVKRSPSRENSGKKSRKTKSTLKRKKRRIRISPRAAATSVLPS